MSFVADGIVCDAPAGRLEGARAYQGFLESFLELLKSAEMIAAFGDDEEALPMYDTETVPVPSAPAAYFKVEDGKITRLRFHLRPGAIRGRRGLSGRPCSVTKSRIHVAAGQSDEPEPSSANQGEKEKMNAEAAAAPTGYSLLCSTRVCKTEPLIAALRAGPTPGPITHRDRLTGRSAWRPIRIVGASRRPAEQHPAHTPPGDAPCRPTPAHADIKTAAGWAFG